MCQITRKPGPYATAICWWAQAVLVDKKAEPAAVSAAFAKAGQQRAQGVRVTVLKRGKNAKRQKEQLTALGYNEIQEVF